MQQSVHFMRIGKTTLASLTGVGLPVVERWLQEGLPVCRDGRGIYLFRAMRWLHDLHEKQQREKALLTKLSQIQVAELLDVSRQSVYEWTRLGLPRGEDKKYSLPEAMAWIRLHYRRCAEERYQKHMRTLSADLERKISRAKAK